MKELRVLILEDEMVIARDIQRMLQRLGVGSIEIVINSQELLAIYQQFKPHLVLCDINIEETFEDGITLCKRMLTNLQTHIIFITANAKDDYLIRAQGVNPLNYLLKPFNDEQVTTTIALALSKKEVQEGGYLKKNYSMLLTESEYKIIKLISENKTTADIAGLLFISPKTVENHRSNISHKLELDGKNNSLLSWAIQHKSEL